MCSGRADNNRVDVVLFPVDQFAEIAVLSCIRISLGRFAQESRIDIAQGDDVVMLHLSNDRPATIAHADAGQVDLLARRSVANTSQDVARYDGKCCQCGAGG